MLKQVPEDKRVTVKILRSLYEQAKDCVKVSGDYSTDSHFLNDAIKEKIDRETKRLRN